MSDKYIQYLLSLPVGLLHVAQSFAKDNQSPEIEPAHLFRALLHKSIGLVNFFEDTLDEDYYYLLDWCDIRVRQCDRSPYGMKEAVLSDSSRSVVKEAMDMQERFGVEEPRVEFILAALVSPGVGFTSEQLKTMPLKAEKVLAAVAGQGDVTERKPAERTSHNKGDRYSSIDGICSSMLSDYAVQEIIGVEDKIRSVIEVLARKDRANVLIVGESGVGKTSLVQGLLNLAVEDKLPSSLAGMAPYELDMISLSQGVSYKGEIEDRFKKVIGTLSENEHPVLVIEGLHRVEDKQSALNAILPVLRKSLTGNKVQFICTTTVDGFTKDIEKDKELTAYFEKITVEAPSEELAEEILRSKCPAYERFHSMSIEDDVVAETVRLAKRYLPERNLPSSAIDLLDRAMASVKIENELSQGGQDNTSEVVLSKSVIRDVVSRMTGIPMGNIQSEERTKLSNAEEILHKRVVGQNHAIKSILDAVFESRSGLKKKGQPIGSFFFLGPTGTGKTELAKSLAEFLFNDETAILRFDMSEYKEEHSVALLYGAPPGYVGYEEGGLLVNQIRQHPYSVVLFDEIEKAHRSVFDLFLQILDEGKLHDRLGRVGDFSNSLIIFTSNIGSDYIFKSFAEGVVPTHDQMLEVMQGQFRPEFLARLTEIVPFSPITEEMINKIFDIHIQNLLKTLREQNISLEIDDSARAYVTKVGFNAHYGARPILGIIRKEIRRPLSKLIISGDVNPGDSVVMKYDQENKAIVWDIETCD